MAEAAEDKGPTLGEDGLMIPHAFKYDQPPSGAAAAMPPTAAPVPAPGAGAPTDGGIPDDPWHRRVLTLLQALGIRAPVIDRSNHGGGWWQNTMAANGLHPGTPMPQVASSFLGGGERIAPHPASRPAAMVAGGGSLGHPAGAPPPIAGPFVALPPTGMIAPPPSNRMDSAVVARGSGPAVGNGGALAGPVATVMSNAAPPPAAAALVSFLGGRR